MQIERSDGRDRTELSGGIVCTLYISGIYTRADEDERFTKSLRIHTDDGTGLDVFGCNTIDIGS